MLDLDAGHEHLVVQAPLDLARMGRLEEQLQRLDEVIPRILDRAALAGDVELGAEGDVRVVLAFDDRCQLAGGLQGLMIAVALRQLRGSDCGVAGPAGPVVTEGVYVGL